VTKSRDDTAEASVGINFRVIKYSVQGTTCNSYE